MSKQLMHLFENEETIFFLILSTSNPNSLYETALQSALCSDQSHFSRFECYHKKDKEKNILILFRYSAKLKKSQTRAEQSCFLIVKR
jgi:hypothetical protein